MARGLDRLFPALALALSIMGTVMVLPLALYCRGVDGLLWRKPIIGLILTIICLFGMIAAISPGRCSRVFSPKRRGETEPHEAGGRPNCPAIRFKGHHPDCGGFKPHTINICDKTLCAACTGLLIGALLILPGVALYFFLGWDISTGIWGLMAGQFGVCLGLFQFKFRGYARLLANTLLVASCFIILIGVEGIARSLVLDLYTIALILFLLYTRVIISSWDHRRICMGCGSRAPL
jgi:hypothetical protein